MKDTYGEKYIKEAAERKNERKKEWKKERKNIFLGNLKCIKVNKDNIFITRLVRKIARNRALDMLNEILKSEWKKEWDKEKVWEIGKEKIKIKKD